MKVGLSTLALMLSGASAHSWVEQLMNIAPNGTMTGQPGYMRGFVARNDPKFSDDAMVNKILVSTLDPNTVKQSLQNTPMCKSSQQQPQQSSQQFPRLKASPGSPVALRYLENGHVTKPDTPPNKPPNTGTLLVYGTYNPKSDEKLLDVWNSWTTDGSGGDKRGFLLSNNTFDDKQCYENNPSPVSTQRQQQFPKQNDQLQGANLWCQTDLVIPTDAKPNQPLTLYWVWDWRTMPAGGSQGEIETYTSCMDLDITAAQSQTQSKAVSNGFAKGQDWNSAAAISQFPHLSAQGQGNSGNSGSGSGSGGSSSSGSNSGSGSDAGSNTGSGANPNQSSAAGSAGSSTQTVAAMSAVSSAAGGAGNSGFQTVTVTSKCSFSPVPLPPPASTALGNSAPAGSPGDGLTPAVLATQASVSTVMVTVTQTEGQAGPTPAAGSSSAEGASPQPPTTGSPAAQVGALPSGAPNQPGFSVLPIPNAGSGSGNNKRHLSQHKRYVVISTEPTTFATLVTRARLTDASSIASPAAPTTASATSNSAEATFTASSLGRPMWKRFLILPGSDAPPRAPAPATKTQPITTSSHSRYPFPTASKKVGKECHACHD
ncbi:MAG: hypothetical protein Q9160_006846 [Pyrenula sp. 1 TL-2023]